MPEKLIGKITHYFGKIGVGVVACDNAAIRVGDRLHVKGSHTDFTQVVDSLQIDKQKVEKITAGESAGLKVMQPVHEHDQVFLITD
jgi:hypothetical protein